MDLGANGHLPRTLLVGLRRVWGSGAGADETGRGTFSHLLEFSRPETFSQHGKLSVRQIDRMLKRRKM